MSSCISVYARCRPHEGQSCIVANADQNSVLFRHNAREYSSQFQFSGVFGDNSTQDDIFRVVALPIIDSSLSGVNGTIFAYGQTGSGKTYTVTGGTDSYADRGIIPRVISHIFKKVEEFSIEMAVSISYMEIYKDCGYDLLGRKEQQSPDLPRVFLQEDEEGKVSFRNLTIRQVASESESLDLLFLGDTSRVVAETSMNAKSSRSHCLFCIHLASKVSESNLVRTSKLYIVDLAGSERLSKTCSTDSQTFAEGSGINLSLHYLEQVIVALNEKSKGTRDHIPYRNSLLTAVLRDSLGGNCRTAMIANISGKCEYMAESITTCRFATRVGMIENVFYINEELDQVEMIRELRQEVRSLQEELSLLKNSSDDSELSSEQVSLLKDRVVAYLEDYRSNCGELICGSVARVRKAFAIMKDILRERLSNTENESDLKQKILVKDLELERLTAIIHVQNGNDPQITLNGSNVLSLPSPVVVVKTELSFTEFLNLHPELGEVPSRDKDTLKNLCSQGKMLGKIAADARQAVSDRKSQLVDLQGCTEYETRACVVISEIQQQKELYVSTMTQLKSIKSEIDQIQRCIEQRKQACIREFNIWREINTMSSDGRN